jgi:hypothetical protein
MTVTRIQKQFNFNFWNIWISKGHMDIQLIRLGYSVADAAWILNIDRH